MNNSLKAQQYKQNLKVVMGLLKLYGKTDPEAATRSLNAMTVDLLAAIRNNQPNSIDAEVIR